MKEMYAVEKQEVEKAKEMYQQKVAVLRAAIAINSDKDEFTNFDAEVEHADINLSEESSEARLDHSRPPRRVRHHDDADQLGYEEEVLQRVLHLREEDSSTSLNADAASA